MGGEWEMTNVLIWLRVGLREIERVVMAKERDEVSHQMRAQAQSQQPRS